MKKALFFCLTAAIALQVTTAFTTDNTDPTPEEIQKAQTMRDLAIKAGADKISDEQIIALAAQSMPKEVSPEQRKQIEQAVICSHHKIADLSYRKPIKDFARFTSNTKYQQEIKEQIDSECHLAQLNAIMGKK
ncbi:MAG: hypothetical protein M0O96_11995 [Desulforhopalus sp.]|nr:hypothetical protein [Desulforhopalus sp.]